MPAQRDSPLENQLKINDTSRATSYVRACCRGQQEAAEPPSEGSWQIGSTQGKSPAPRYEHAVAAMEGSMFVVAGNCGTRALCTW